MKYSHMQIVVVAGPVYTVIVQDDKRKVRFCDSTGSKTEFIELLRDYLP